MKSYPKYALWSVASLALTLFATISDGNAANLKDVKLGLLPISSQTPVFIAQSNGYFKDEGLNVSTQMFQGGPEVTAAVIGGDIDFGYVAAASPIVGFAQGAPVRIVAPSDVAGTDKAHYVNVILVRGDSEIKSLSDLAGNRVAVNQLKGILELAVRAGVDGAGGDSSKIMFVEAPFPQMASLLATKQVAAVVNAEPFITQMVANGDRPLAHAAAVLNGSPLGVWVTSAQKSGDRDMIDRFRRAIGKANAYASSNSDKVRELIPTFTRISTDVAAKIALPIWTQTVDIPSLQFQADLLSKYKFIDRRVDVTGLVVSDGP